MRWPPRPSQNPSLQDPTQFSDRLLDWSRNNEMAIREAFR